MNYKVTKLACLVAMFATLVAYKQSFADSWPSIRLLKERLMRAKPRAFSLFNMEQLLKLTAQAKHTLQMANESGESAADRARSRIEFANYCTDAKFAFDLIHQLEHDIQSDPMNADIEDKLSLAEVYVASVEERSIASEDTDYPNQQLQQSRNRAIAQLKRRLREVEPSFEGAQISSLKEVVKWRSQKEAVLKMVETERLTPMYDFQVHQAKAQSEYALYCEASFRASEALNELESDLRRAPMKQQDLSFDKKLLNADVLVGTVEGRQLSHHDALMELEAPLAALKKMLKMEESSLLLMENPEALLEIRQNEFLEAKQFTQHSPGHPNAVARGHEVLQAETNLQYAIYNQKAWEASEVIKLLEADLLSGEVVIDSNIFEERFSAAQILVSKVQGHKLEYVRMTKCLAHKQTGVLKNRVPET